MLSVSKEKSFTYKQNRALETLFNPFQFPLAIAFHKESISPTSTENIYLYFRQFSTLIG